ncbi:basic leucine zipper transcriptional factor ATF-like 2 isoform X1 [Suricata suricatta]|uniref:Basic leucine zipper transcriptional factor ATF-like 2 n=1 Tax=Suricata suricatta TaxID=37032 RepID=A0A673USA2_SURSU|nr:basic leucine zipper transcriptional factor ATF-like 2 isoform X1 [Suricata suricatta]
MHLCEGNGLLTRTDLEEHQRLKKKQKNRVAAQRSRQKHTDKADALHQQHETLEKHNRLLRKEIQGLQAELVWWSRTLHSHECLCLMGCAPCLAPVPPGCWGLTEQPLDPMPGGQYDFQEQPGLFQTPASSPSVHQLSPDLQPHSSSGGLLSPLPSLSLGSTMVSVPPPQLSPSPVQSASPTGSSLLRPSSKLKTLLPSPPAQLAPLQPLVGEHHTRGKLGSSPDSPSPALGLACLQGREHRPVLSATDQPGLGVDPSSHPLLAFPLLSSAQVHF